jgi:putative oxidoreductase
MTMGHALADVVGRLLLAHMFLISGFNKISGFADTQAYMESAGLAGALLPVVILIEIGGAVLLIFGWQTRWAALALAVFTALAAFFFHTEFGDQMQVIQWMKNWTIVGGMLVVFAFGPGPYSLDARRARRHTRAL